MIIGIIGAMDKEIYLLKQEMDVVKVEKKASMEFYVGKIYDRDIVIVKSGVGKVNAAICTQILCDDFNIDYVINTGIAGGVKDGINIGDIVISTDLVYHDVDASAFGEKVGQVPNMDVYSFNSDKYLVDIAMNSAKKIQKYSVYKGRIVSGDQIVSNPEKIVNLREFFNAYATEMEGAAIAHTCFLNNVKFVIIRSISDRADDNAHMDYNEFQGVAIKNSINILNDMIKSM